MRYASVCSGIEAATVAWHPLGWKPVWFSQYDPEHNYGKSLDFPSETLKYHYPQVPNLGDMLKITQTKTYIHEQFELLVGGTPCQAFSIAGLRSGLRDERSNLALEFVRILTEKRPTWFVWENVPGVLTSGKESTDEGYGEEDDEPDADPRDFACLLSAWTGRDIAPQEFEKGGVIEAESEEYYSVSWRIFDSQYFGVPQRRRRIFVVGYLGKDWRPPIAVLFEQDSLRRDFTPRGKKGKGAARNTKGSAGSDSERVVPPSSPAELASTLNCQYGNKMGLDNQHINSDAPLFVPLQIEVGFRQRGFGDYTADDTASALKKRDYKDATDLIVASIDCRNDAVNDAVNDEISGTLQAKSSGGHSLNYINPVIISKGHTEYGIQSVAIGRKPENGGNGLGFKEEQAPTLTKADRHAMMYTQEMAIPINTMNVQGRPSDNGRMGSGIGENGDPQNTISKNHSHAVCHVVYDTTQVTSPENGSNPQPGDPCHPLVSNGHPPLLVEQTFTPSHYTRGFGPHGLSGTLKKEHNDNSPHVLQQVPHVFKEREGKEGGGKGYLGSDELAFTRSGVQDQKLFYKTLIRRLTPMECLRLQGFPDDYLCNVPGYSDSKAYSACGNSMTTWVMQHIGKRIDLVDKTIKMLREPNAQVSDTTKFNP